MTGRSSYLDVPLGLREELVRPTLIARLAERWDVPVTVVVGGAGFGKTTALAQAVRHDRSRRPASQGWVSIQPGFEQAETLASAMARSLGRTRPGRGPLADLIGLAQESPGTPLCVVLDDVHLLPPGSSAMAMLADLVRRMPPELHVVFVSRAPVPLPLARLRAGEQVCDVGEDDLAFADDEVERLAACLGLDTPVADLGGWPALVRLSLVTHRTPALGFAREEVITGLSPTDRATLLALATIGLADEDLVAQVCRGPVDLAGLAHRVPLVVRVGPRAYRAHELWLDAVDHRTDPDLLAIPRRCVQVLLEHGELARAGAIAVRHGEWDALDAIALRLVQTTVMALPADLARSWLDHVPARWRDTGGLLVLAAAEAYHRDFNDPRVDDLVDRALAGWTGPDHDRARGAALTIGLMAAQMRFDRTRLGELERVAGAGDGPAEHAVGCCLRATLLEMAGDPESALAEIRTLTPGLAAGTARLVARLEMRSLMLAGRPADAAASAEAKLSGPSDPSSDGACDLGARAAHHLRHTAAFGRWLAGDPSGFATARQVEDYERELTEVSARDRLVGAILHAVVAASWGRVSPPAAAVLPDGPLCSAQPRDAALVVNAQVAMAVAAHAEDEAARCLERYLAVIEPGFAPADRTLRRSLALGYVVSPRLRADWDRAMLSPTEERLRRIARAVVTTRAGRLPAQVPTTPAVVFTTLPLPWSVELACRLIGLGSPAGRVLARWLVDRVGAPVRTEARWLAATAGGGAAGGAQALLAELPIPPNVVTHVSVLGPMEVHRAGAPVSCAELRRTRVRELLSVLLVERVLTRETLSDLLWPDRAAEDGQRNLRVTLAYLRRLLEPDRRAGEAPYHLRADQIHVRLHAGDHLTCDLWQATDLLTRAAQSLAAGDRVAALDLQSLEIGLWRGPGLLDLIELDCYEPTVTHTTLGHLRALISLGDHHLAADRPDDALRLADLALAFDEYGEHGHRLRIAALAALGDPRRAARAERTLHGYLDDLGVPDQLDDDYRSTAGTARSQCRPTPSAGTTTRRQVDTTVS